MRRVIAVLVLAGCQQQHANVQIEDVRVTSLVGGTTIEIDVANKGFVSAWVHTWPFRIAASNEEVIIGLHGEEPGLEEESLRDFTPVVHYERLAPPANLLGKQQHTIEVALPNEVGPIDARVIVPEVPEITVEVAWHEHDPGIVEPEDAPDPVGVEIETVAN